MDSSKSKVKVEFEILKWSWFQISLGKKNKGSIECLMQFDPKENIFYVNNTWIHFIPEKF